ncbi:MAG: thiamine-phosphate kinase [Rikenellaceae bacterium]
MSQRTELNTLGRNRFVQRLTSPFTTSTIGGLSDDAAVIDRGDKLEVISKTLLTEGIDFDLTYTPLEHLGLKAISVSISNILAMNATAEYVMIGLGISSRFSVEEIEAIYRGIEHGLSRYSVELIGGDTAPSLAGLTISVTVIGSVAKDSLTLRSGASPDELLCSTGTLGAAYMGLHLLEREKRAGTTQETARSIFQKHTFILNKQLQPFARVDIVELLAENNIVPTSMIDISSGLASATLSLCASSEVGARIHLNKLPVNKDVSLMADELNADPIVAMLNGGDDCELLFTVPLSAHDKVAGLADIHIIGFITSKETGAALVTPDGEAIKLTSPDFKEDEQEEQ